MMATKNNIVSQSRKSKQIPASVLQLKICGVTCAVNKERLAEKCAKVAALIEENPEGNLSDLLGEIPTDPQTFELVARFCHGYEIEISTENVVRVSWLAYYLGMTEDHRAENLLKKAVLYFQRNVLPSWNKCVRSLKTMESFLQQSIEIGMVDECAESIIAQAINDPRLLGEPIKKVATSEDDGDEKENGFRPNARRRLFDLEWKCEDLSVLALMIYEPIIRAMIHRHVPLEYVTVSLCQYAKVNPEREEIEAVQRLLPDEKGMVSCRELVEMLRSGIESGSSAECVNGFEIRIGKQLDLATVDDLKTLCQIYSTGEKYDAECVKRILKNYYCNYPGSDMAGLIKASELINEFLAEVACDTDLDMTTFVSLADLSVSVSVAINGSSDGVYRAVDIYLDKHAYLTESEREEICSILDCNRMSPEACEHAAQNKRLPLRVVVQVLFVGQLKLRDSIAREIQSSEIEVVKVEDDEAKDEMKKMSNEVSEVEKDCRDKKSKEKGSVWKQMKRKLGCMTTMHDCNCHVKKKKAQSKIVK